MNIPSLDNFNTSIDDYISTNSADIQNLLSQSQFNIEELRQKGEAFLSMELVTGPLMSKGFGMTGITADDVLNAPGKIADTISDTLGDVIPSVVTKGVELGKAGYQMASKGYTTLSNKLSNPVASKIEGDVDPEFGVSSEDLMNTLNTGLSKIPNSSSFISRTGGSSDVADLSALREPLYGSDVAKIGEAVPEAVDADVVNTVIPSASDVVAPVESLATAVTEGATAGTEAIAEGAGLEIAGAALDATGIGAPAGLLLGIIGAVAGGYSLFQGFEDMFKHVSDTVTLPSFSVPEFQSS
jgi:hypothetical protein